MSWLGWAIDDPAPGNCGYAFLGVPCELIDPSLRHGLVIHSVEGWFTYDRPSAVMKARGNSWGVTIMRSGQVWRHRPRPTFVNWHAGGPAQNIGTDGIEMEGKDQPWTDAQRASLVRVLRETWAWFGWQAYTLAGPTDRTQEGVRLALLAHGYGSLWEHNWFDYTSCPSGRNDWPWLMPELQAQPVIEEDDMFLVRAMPTGRTFIVGTTKTHLSQPAVDVYIAKGIEPPFEWPDADVDAIPDTAIAAHVTSEVDRVIGSIPSGGSGPSEGTFRGEWHGVPGE